MLSARVHAREQRGPICRRAPGRTVDRSRAGFTADGGRRAVPSLGSGCWYGVAGCLSGGRAAGGDGWSGEGCTARSTRRRRGSMRSRLSRPRYAPSRCLTRGLAAARECGGPMRRRPGARADGAQGPHRVRLGDGRRRDQAGRPLNGAGGWLRQRSSRRRRSGTNPHGCPGPDDATAVRRRNPSSWSPAGTMQ